MTDTGRRKRRRIGRATGLLREALAGGVRDYTSGSLTRAVFLLSIPMVLEMAMESLFGIVDALFVGHLGPDAVAAVGITESLLTLVFGVALGLSLSTTAFVARRIGEGDDEEAANTAVQAIAVGLAVSLPVTVVGVLHAPALLALMGAPPGVITGGSTFARWILGGNATILLLFLVNAIFRGAGDAAIAMRALWVANAVNLVLDPCLIFGLGPFPRLGLTGAAVATTIGRSVGVAYQVRALVRGRGRLVIRRRHVRLQPALMLRLLKVSVGGMFQFLVPTASSLGLVRILTPFGAAALAGYTIALRIVVVAILPAWGMCNAAATLVGQNLGAGRPERAERSVWLAGLYAMGFLTVVGLGFLLAADPLVALFSPDAAVRDMAATCLRVLSYGYVFYGWGMVMIQAFNGAGDTTTPTWVNLGCYWFFQVPLAWVLAREAGFGPTGVFLAITVAESLMAVVGIACFRRGTWKTRVV